MYVYLCKYLSSINKICALKNNLGKSEATIDICAICIIFLNLCYFRINDIAKKKFRTDDHHQYSNERKLASAQPPVRNHSAYEEARALPK